MLTLAEMLEKAISMEIVVENDEGGHTRYYIAEDQLDLAREALSRNVTSERRALLECDVTKSRAD